MTYISFIFWEQRCRRRTAIEYAELAPWTCGSSDPPAIAALCCDGASMMAWEQFERSWISRSISMGQPQRFWEVGPSVGETRAALRRTRRDELLLDQQPGGCGTLG